MKLDILVFAAHPDDAELNAGGTISALVSRGNKVGIIDLTKGEMGTRGNAITRSEEVKQSSSVLGIDYRLNLDLGDSLINNTRENQINIIEQIRLTKPNICLIGSSYDRHPDHGKATQLCVDSLFYSGLTKIKTMLHDVEQDAHRPTLILQYMQDLPFEPDFIFDISKHWETKKRAILAFGSQFNVVATDNEPETYISSSKYFSQIEARARHYGHLAGFEMGEAFKKLNGKLGLNTLKDVR